MVSRALMAAMSTLPMPFQAKMVSVMVEPANQGKYRAYDDGRNRNQRVAEGMGINDDLLLQALGRAVPDIVLVEGIDHGVANDADGAGDGDERQHDGGQDEVLKPGKHVLHPGEQGSVGHAAKGQPA